MRMVRLMCLASKAVPWWKRADRFIISPSQIDFWGRPGAEETCLRKWAFKYTTREVGCVDVDHIPLEEAQRLIALWLRTSQPLPKGHELEPYLSSMGRLFGNEVHRTIYEWLKNAVSIDRDPEIARILMPYIKTLPAPKAKGVLLEHEGYLRTGTADYYLKIDAAWLDEERGIPIVRDHKTTRNFRWSLSEEELAQNTQALLYGGWVMDHFQKDHCEVTFGYIRTEGAPKCELRTVRIIRADVENALDEIDRTAQDVLAGYQCGWTPLQFPPTPATCEAYGGCPYRSICNLTPKEQLRAIMAIKTLEEMRKRSQANKEATGTAAPASAAQATTAAAASPATTTAAAGAAAREAVAKRGAGELNPPPPAGGATEAPTTVERKPGRPPAAEKIAAPVVNVTVNTPGDPLLCSIVGALIASNALGIDLADDAAPAVIAEVAQSYRAAFKV
jgi:hypothetical protein